MAKNREVVPFVFIPLPFDLFIVLISYVHQTPVFPDPGFSVTNHKGKKAKFARCQIQGNMKLWWVLKCMPNC